MEDIINIIFFNKTDDLIEEIQIEKPETYSDLLNNLKKKFIEYLPKYY